MESYTNESSLGKIGFDESGILHKVLNFYKLKRTELSMNDVLYVKTRLDNILNTVIPQYPEQLNIYNARKDILTWLYNDGKLRTENELNTMIESIQGEILVMEFAEDRGVSYLSAVAKLKELSNVVNNQWINNSNN